MCLPATILMNCDLIQWCAGMCLTTGSPEAGVGETWFVLFANFFGVNIPTMAFQTANATDITECKAERCTTKQHAIEFSPDRYNRRK